MELVAGTTLRHLIEVRAARGRRGRRHRRPRGHRARGGPPGRDRAPRHQAGQRPPVLRRPGPRDRLRDREGRRGGRPHDRTDDARDRRVPGARQSRWARRRPRRHLLPRRVLYEMVCGRPFTADTDAATALARLTATRSRRAECSRASRRGSSARSSPAPARDPRPARLGDRGAPPPREPTPPGTGTCTCTPLRPGPPCRKPGTGAGGHRDPRPSKSPGGHGDGGGRPSRCSARRDRRGSVGHGHRRRLR